jgi:hypothetical protein
VGAGRYQRGCRADGVEGEHLMNELFATLAFLSLFCLIGGAAIGSVVRTWRKHGPSFNSTFLLIWGGLFAGIPFLMGIVLFAAHGAFYLLGIQLGLLIGIILLVAFVPDLFLESFDLDKIAPVAFGGLFLLIGVVVAMTSITSEPLMALVFLVAFGGIGGLLFLQGVRAALKS